MAKPRETGPLARWPEKWPEASVVAQRIAGAAIPNDYSPDGTTLLTFVQTPSAAGDLYTLTLGPKPVMTPFVATPFDESAATFSPDGRWVAY